MVRRSKMAWFIVLVLNMSFAAYPPAAASVTDQQVDDAIMKIKAYLYEKQDAETGTWEFRSTPGGIKRDVVQRGAETAVVTYAMLVSGESYQNPKLSRALEFLQQLDPIGTYAVSMRAHTWARLPLTWSAMLEKDAGWLMQAADSHPHSLFYYQMGEATPYIDNGVVQYGLLGLWEASKRGYKVPRKYWQTWLEHFLGCQRADGNWTYAANPDEKVEGIGSGNIFDTTGIGDAANAGLAAMLIIQQELFRSRKTPDPKTSAAINKGLDWLNRHFDLATGQSGYNHFYVFGIERIAAACGVRYLNGQDWYQVGAEQIIHQLKTIQKTEYDSLQMAFALMFLSRGQYPVWIAKLNIPGVDSNNRPNDLHFLNLHLSDQREGELNWQAIDIDAAPPEAWLMSPVLYLSSGQRVALNPEQRQRLKRYLDMGGLLVTCAENRSSAFNQSIRELAGQMYPQHELKRLDPGDPLCRSWHQLTKGFDMPVESVSNGARHLILIVNHDWGYSLQADAPQDDHPAWAFAANLYAYATNRGVPNNRLVTPIEDRQKRAQTASFTIGRALYDGNWLPEPAAWDLLANPLFNRTGLNLETTSADARDALKLDQIGASDLKLIHLAGVEPVHFTETQLEAIKTYVHRGGTLLVENVGGRGGFSKSVRQQLASLFSSQPTPLSASDPIISGQGLPNGYDCHRTVYRRYSVLEARLDPIPRLWAFFDSSNQPRVIISDHDLSTGLLGGKHWGIDGYQPASARELMTNLVLWSKQQSLSVEAD